MQFRQLFATLLSLREYRIAVLPEFGPQFLIVFSRDVLPLADDGTPPDIAWLEKREAELGVSIQRMLSAERHLLKGRTHEQMGR